MLEKTERAVQVIPALLTDAALTPAERTWLQSPEGLAHLAYWLSLAEGQRALLDLPTSRARETEGASEFTTYEFVFSDAVAQAMMTYGTAQKQSPEAVVLAIFQILLHRYTGQTDIIVMLPAGSASGDRWAQVLLSRVDHVTNPTFADVIAKVSAGLSAGRAHGGVPLSILRHLYPAMDQLLFDSVDDTATLDASPASTLRLSLSQTGSTFGGALTYNTATHAASIIESLAQHLLTLLAEAVTTPEMPVGYLSLLTKAEQLQVLTTWNRTALPFDTTVGIHGLFEDQVARTPNAPALIFEHKTLSYRELDQRVNQLAHYLRTLGVVPGVLVGVCIERSIEMVIGLLAILKAGSAYVPLDPNYPEERVTFMLEDTQAPIVLTQHTLLPRLEQVPAHLVCLDTDWPTIEQCANTSPAIPLFPDMLGYIIYTSGSTGRPKGVMISHRNAVAMLTWAAEEFPREVLSGSLAVTSICFDLSIFELFLPLSQGGTVILARNALHLLTLPARDQVTLINTVPSAVAELVKADGLPDSVQIVNLAGEPLKRVLVQQIYAHSNTCAVYNLYGPSEDTTYSTFAMAAREDTCEPTIGHPIGNTQAYVLDKRMQPVPVGVVGELYLGGDGVSRGYLKRPEMTAQRYVPDPFSGEPGARLYYTGDVVRYRAAGELEFLGRSDYQVKIRGFRIELGELDAVLSQHPNIATVVVVAREAARGEKRLVAYYVAVHDPAPTISELRRHVQASLPEYMTPAVFVRLDKMPLTPTGKINRQELPEPDHVRPTLETPYVAPLTLAETHVAAIWEDVLGIQGVGVHDDFFELGGQSLLAMQVVARMDSGLDLPYFFEHATVMQLAEALDAGESSTMYNIPLQVASHQGEFATTMGQRQLWFLGHLAPEMPTYNIPLVLNVAGAVDPALVERSLNAIVARHEVLRTTCHEVDGLLMQIVNSPHPIDFAVADLRDFPAAERDAEAEGLIDTEARRCFNLTQDVLLRGMVLLRDASTTTLLVTVHHIAFDGWSTGVLIQELGALYTAFAAGESAALPDLPVQYGDFALWQAGYHESDVQVKAQAYWQTALAGDISTLDIPSDRPRPAVQTYLGAKRTRPLSQEFIDALEAFSREHNVSLFMTMLAAYGVLLSRYSKQEDVIVGVPIANRAQTEVEGLLGYFLNTLSMRINVSGAPTFTTLLAQVRSMVLGTFAYQGYPIERVVQQLGLKRDLSYNPLFQVMLAVQNLPIAPADMAGATMAYVEERNTGTSKLDLTLFLEFLASGPVLFFEYSTELFDAATIDRMLDHYVTLLESILADRTQPVDVLALVPAAERYQQLTTWNATPAPKTSELLLPQRVTARAAQTPDRVAVTGPVLGKDGTSQSLTYAEINACANQLAHHLRSWGVGPDVPVGIYMERSVEMVVGLLGILKAGGTYVPIDPAYPADRIAYMLGDVNASVVLTQRSLCSELPVHRARVLCLDTDQLLIEQFPTAEPPVVVRGANVAYIIYTSGSTGKPKGVQISHAAFANFLDTMQQRPGFSAEDTLLALTTLSFDIAGLELWLPLSVGAHVVIASRDDASDAARLQALMCSSQATVMQATPATWRMIMADGWPGDPALTAFCGGEALPPELAQKLTPRVKALWNLYGPTETTVWSTIWPVEADESISIGRPIANTELYILDAHFKPMPIGVPGDLYIGGAGLARGYFQRPALTAEKFIPHPFSEEPGARLYKTGDIARYRADGNVEFLGRSDHQVKIRGFRIELGEIENVLVQHPSVQNAVVVACDDGRGDKQLAAYMIGVDIPDVGALRSFLLNALPSYMVPGVFMPLAEFPLTPSGKVDRQALLALEMGRPMLASEFVTPRNDFEEIVAEIWEEVLQQESIGVFDDFFELGGHSLMAMQVASRIRERFEVDLPVRVMFESSTIASLATYVEDIILAEITGLDTV